MSNKKSILELKRKNKIAVLCKLWMNNNIQISINDFLQVDETLCIQNKILNKLHIMDNKHESNVYIEKEIDIISIFTDYIINNININKSYVFFVKDATKIGGLILGGDTIINKHEFIIKESEFFDKGCSIFFCTLHAESGVCLWRGEYDSRIYVW